MFVVLAALVAVFTSTYMSSAAPSIEILPRPALDASDAEHEGIDVSSHEIRLLPDAPSPPVRFKHFYQQSYDRYGYYLSPLSTARSPVERVRVSYQHTAPVGTMLTVAVRGSVDGSRWTAWEVELADGEIVTFPAAVRHLQYRAMLLGDATTSPTLSSVNFQALAAAEGNRTRATSQAGQIRLSSQSTPSSPSSPSNPSPPPTYRVHATRLGLVGGRTANGHIIQPRDRFVALPSTRSLCSKGGHEYQVRLTYQGRSVVAPVWDVGPWNIHDDYWSVHREWYQDLPRGWPQDHAAYFDGYNNGMAEKGYVHHPTAIDVADGLWWDALQIPSGSAEIEVTFLWEGQAEPAPPPLQQPEPEPATTGAANAAGATTIMVDTHDGGFAEDAVHYWYHHNGCGKEGHALWTYTTNDPAHHENSATWAPAIAEAGMYEVYAYVPLCSAGVDDPTTQSAHYQITHRDGTTVVAINQAAKQAAKTGWVSLGTYPFASGTAGMTGKVVLKDIANDSMHVLWVDAMKWEYRP
jgi:hypothetical protein